MVYRQLARWTECGGSLVGGGRRGKTCHRLKRVTTQTMRGTRPRKGHTAGRRPLFSFDHPVAELGGGNRFKAVGGGIVAPCLSERDVGFLPCPAVGRRARRCSGRGWTILAGPVKMRKFEDPSAVIWANVRRMGETHGNAHPAAPRLEATKISSLSRS